MRSIPLASLLVSLFASSVSADVPQAGPLTKPGVCIVTITNATPVKTIAQWCGVTNTSLGAAGFVVANNTADLLCLGGPDIDTTPTVGGKCFPIRATATGVNGKPEQAVRGTIHSWYLRAPVGVTAVIMYGATP